MPRQVNTAGTGRQRFLFVRPPRPVWPFNGPSTRFWPPLAFASLAAALRQSARDLDVEILDAPILEMGWRSLTDELRRRRPEFVAIGEEAVSCVEGLRLARLARDCGARVIAGGCFFGHVAGEVLNTGLVDVVVHGEGEETIVELLGALRSGNGDDLRRVAGISFRSGAERVFTGPRPLIPDLDSLPLPAYDLLPTERYGRHSRNHPRFAAIELGRGCVDACDFCVLWRQMGQFAGARLQPRLRVKSPERLLEEIRILRRRYDRQYLGWVDPCFNADPEVPGQLAELLLRHELAMGQSAWVRADCLLRDHRSGALAHCVRAGLNELYIGAERLDAPSLAALGKRGEIDDSRQAFRLLADRYPQVFSVGSFIYGLAGDTPASIRQMYDLSLRMPMDKAFFIPLTPLPGTPYWRPDLWDRRGEAFRRFDFLPHAGWNGEGRLDRALARHMIVHWPPARIRGYLRGLLRGGRRRRSLTWRLAIRSAGFTLRVALPSLLGRRQVGGMLFPKWYER